MLTEIAFSLLDIEYVTFSSAHFERSASQIDMSAGKEKKRKAAGESKSERAMSQPLVQPRGHPEDAAAAALICHPAMAPADSSQVHWQLIPKPVLEYSTTTSTAAHTYKHLFRNATTASIVVEAKGYVSI